MDYHHIIIGGGIYGCFAALRLASVRRRGVLVVEQEPDLMRRASYNNQARVHGGYHYPRSVLTALRSRINAPRFLSEFKQAICSDFEQYYAISRRQSNVTASQFEQFCRRIGADVKPARADIGKLFDDEFIEAVFRVTEPAFDADKLRECLRERLAHKGIKVLTGTEATRIVVDRGTGAAAEQRFRLDIRNVQSGDGSQLSCKYLYNCTYSRLNEVLARSGLQTIHLRHEATEIALVELPPVLRGLSITVMCGPFFSLMPFPPTPLATLSHVTYTPHYEWVDDPSEGGYHPAPRISAAHRFDRMRRDAAAMCRLCGTAAMCGRFGRSRRCSRRVASTTAARSCSSATHRPTFDLAPGEQD